MAQRTSTAPVMRRGIVAGVLAALTSMMHRGKPVIVSPSIARERSAQNINWLKMSLISQRYAPGARGG